MSGGTSLPLRLRVARNCDNCIRLGAFTSSVLAAALESRTPPTCRGSSAAGGGYSVHADFAVVGRDAGFGADLVVLHLPNDCGPAMVGSAEDLAREIAERDGVPVAEVLERLTPLGLRTLSDGRQVVSWQIDPD